jgi:hypothetical protein
MFPALKRLFIPVVVLALVAGAGAVLQPRAAHADLSGTNNEDGVWFLENYGSPGDVDCEDDGDPREVRLFGTGNVTEINEASGIGDELPVIQVPANKDTDDELIMCVQPNANDLNVVFDTNGGGEWNEAHCGDLDTECVDEEGVGDDALTVVPSGGTNDLSLIAITFSCNGASVQTITIRQDDAFGGLGDEISFRIMCKGYPANMTIGATPTTVEAYPALYNTSHSLIRAVITDSAGNPVLPTTTVHVTTTGCSVSVAAVDELTERNEALFNEGGTTLDGFDLGAIDGEFGTPPLANFLGIAAFSDRDIPLADASGQTIEVDTNAYPDDPEDNADGVPNHSEFLAIFHAEGCDPGVYTVTFEINNPSGTDDVEASTDITVIGAPAFITVTAAPTELICGEKSEITVSVTDANNRAVSDNTKIEVLTNWGGVFGGTGTSLTEDQPVNPLSSTTVEIFDGSGIAYLLTSPAHHGPYEVLAASTQPEWGSSIENGLVTAQVTVNCTLGSETEITAPDTGTGTSVIRPPNTGDGGVADRVGSGTLFAIAGASLVALAGIARRRFARD